jgi:hypothetical protein
MKRHLTIAAALCGIILAGSTTAVSAASANPTPLKTKTASGVGFTQNAKAASSIKIEPVGTAGTSFTVTVDAQVFRNTPTFNRHVVVDPRWQVVTTGCKAPTVSIPTAVYPVPSPGLVVAPRATSTCVKNQTTTTFAGSFSFNANLEARLVGGDRMKTMFRVDLPKGSKVFAIVTNTAVIEYSMGRATAPATALSRVDLKSTVLY